MKVQTEWDDTAFRAALKDYMNLRKNVDPAKEIKRRGKNIGMRLITVYKEKGVVLNDISAKVKSLGKHVKIRPKIRQKARRWTHTSKGQRWTYKRMIAAEVRARKSAKNFTATGWFPSVEKLGGSPRDKQHRTGPKRGKLIEKLTGSNVSETLVNQQPGSVVVANKATGLVQKALDAETADMVKYIVRKQNQAKQRNGL